MADAMGGYENLPVPMQTHRQSQNARVNEERRVCVLNEHNPVYDLEFLAQQENGAPPVATITDDLVDLAEEGEEKGGEEENFEPPQIQTCRAKSSARRTRLRWTPELHGLFVDTVNKLGGPHKATPKAILLQMDVQGLTIYHLKSHLQKYRLGKYSVKECNNDGTNNGGMSDGTSSSSLPPNDTNKSHEVGEASKSQKEVEEKHNVLIEAKTHLQVRQDAEQRYLDLALTNACQMLGNQYVRGAAAGSTGIFEQDFARLTSMAPVPTFYHNQLDFYRNQLDLYHNQRDLYPPRNFTDATKTHIRVEEQPNIFQALQAAPGTATESCLSSLDHSARLYPEGFPALAVGENMDQDMDEEDPLEAYLVWDDEEMNAQDTDLHCKGPNNVNENSGDRGK